MGLGDLGKKAKDAVSSDKGEKTSDSALDRGSDFTDERTGGKHADKIDKGRDQIDDRIGNEGSGGTGSSNTGASDTGSGGAGR